MTHFQTITILLSVFLLFQQKKTLNQNLFKNECLLEKGYAALNNCFLNTNWNFIFKIENQTSVVMNSGKLSMKSGNNSFHLLQLRILEPGQ